MLSKLGAQVAFSPEERPIFWTDSMADLPSLSVPTQDEWRLHEPLKQSWVGRKRMKELTQLFPEAWVEDSSPLPPGWLNITPQ